MSIEKMSATLRREILARLKEQYSGMAGRDSKKLDNFLDYTSSDRIRSDTDTKKGRHESIMSRGAFLNLASDINTVLESNSIAGILDKSLKSTVTYDGFKDYVVNKLNINLDKGKPRVAGDFTYTGSSRLGKESGLTIATENKQPGQGPSERDVLIFRNIPIGILKDYYVEFLLDNLTISGGSDKQKIQKELSSLLNSGHLTGVFNARLVRALGLRKNSAGSIVFDNNKSNNTASMAEQELNKIMTLVTDADYLTSNIVNDVDLFITTDKRLYKNKSELRLTTEIQFAKGNQEAGDLLKQAGRAVSSLTKSVKSDLSTQGQELAVQKSLQSLYKSLSSLANFVKTRAMQLQSLDSGLNKKAKENLTRILNNVGAIENIVKSEGSRSVPQHIHHLVVSILKNTEPIEELTKLNIKEKIVKTKTTRQDTKKVSTKVPKIKAKITSRPVVAQGVVNLENLINTALHDQIRKNMGSGNRTDVLNYRTGRFAKSAKVERISESRQGMITAFYSYMKNPYATFSQGGRQQYPRSRDPKLLISKSIREIAQNLVSNRLRAVNV